MELIKWRVSSFKSFVMITNLINLKYLKFQYIETKSILHESVFIPLPKYLQKLSITYSSIRFLDEQIFTNTKFLIFLDLSFNQLNSLKFNLLKNLGNLKIILLNNNRIQSFTYRIFENLKSLHEIYLKKAFIVKFSTKNLGLDGLKYLKKISMDTNYNCCFFMKKSSVVCYWTDKVLSYCSIININKYIFLTFGLIGLLSIFVLFLDILSLISIKKRISFSKACNITSDIILSVYISYVFLIYFLYKEESYEFSIHWVNSIYCKIINFTLLSLIEFHQFENFFSHLKLFLLKFLSNLQSYLQKTVQNIFSFMVLPFSFTFLLLTAIFNLNVKRK